MFNIKCIVEGKSCNENIIKEKYIELEYFLLLIQMLKLIIIIKEISWRI